MAAYQQHDGEQQCSGNVNSREVKLLSYNLFMRFPFAHSHSTGDRKDARLDYFADHEMQNYDIIAFQELFGFMNSRPSRFVEKFVKHHTGKGKQPQPLYSPSGSSQPSTPSRQGFMTFTPLEHTPLRYHAHLSGSALGHGKPVDSGLWIFSRFPIVEVDSIIFKNGVGSDSWAAKGALSALISIEHGVYILVVTTHLQADYDGSRKYFEVQKKQLHELKQFVDKKIEQHKGILTSAFVLGDFNIDSRKTKITATYPPSLKGINVDTFPSEQTESYKEMMSILNSPYTKSKWVDVIYKDLGYHPVTYGDIMLQTKQEGSSVVIMPKETALTCTAGQLTQLALDYIFMVESDSICKNKATFATIKTGSAKVEQFYVNSRTLTQLSDHYGLSVVIDVPTRSSAATSRCNSSDNVASEQTAIEVIEEEDHDKSTVLVQYSTSAEDAPLVLKTESSKKKGNKLWEMASTLLSLMCCFYWQ